VSEFFKRLSDKHKDLYADHASSIRQGLIISFGFFLGVSAKHYLTGWYSIVFESLMLTGLVGLTILMVRKHIKKIQKNNRK
jgi:hypothetical protein